MNTNFSASRDAAACPDMETFVRQIWLPAIKASRYSWRVDERISRQFILPYFGSMKLSAIDEAEIARWLGTIEAREFAASTRDRILHVLKDIFKTAENMGLLEPGRSPLLGVNLPGERQLDPAKLKTLLDRLLESDKPEARAIALLALTGGSKNEILSARWDNYFPEKKLLVVESAAGKKRRLWLDERATKILEEMRETKTSPWIFPGRGRDKPLSQIFPFWNRLRGECGLEGARLRDLRAAGLRGEPEPGDRPEECRPSRPVPPMPIAVIGMGLRFPGNVDSADKMWETLASGKSAITSIPEDRWPVAELTHPSRPEPGRSVAFAAGVVENIDQFDPSFFGISPREASWMDPQQRLLLEAAHEAMEDAGIPREKLAGAKCGVYIGVSGMDYGQHALDDLASMTSHTMTGNTLSITANRLSYFYDLRGPSLAIDTACSSALAAIHHACQALRDGEIPIALAGGVNLLMHPYSFIGFSHASMLSAKGVCHPFAADGDGYVRGEGGAVFLLKPLDQARRDGDPIRAVILASGVNSDGSRKSGLTIPSAEAQTELMRDTLRKSGLTPDEIDFVEAHGTGTPVGDPIEAASIAAAYCKKRGAPLPISSGKANFGHLEPASGMVGLIRAILTMEKGKIPPAPFAFEPNPAIDFEGMNLVFPAAGYEFPAGKKLKGAVNSFGFGGLNAHVILAEGEKPEAAAPKEPGFPPLFVSAASDGALKELVKEHVARLGAITDEDYYNYAWSCAFRRSAMDKSLAVWADSREEALAELKAWLGGETGKKTVTEHAGEAGGVAFVFSGNGAQWAGMGRDLIAESPEFAGLIDFLDEKCLPVLGYSVREKLMTGSGADLADAAISQPLLFVMQVAVVALLKRLGVCPDAVLGHSVGEVAAAWASGALDLDQAIQVIRARSQSQKLTRGLGGMAAAGLSATAARDLIEELKLASALEIAAINSPANVTVSGESAALDLFGAELKKRNAYFKRLDLDYAFHSRQMERARSELDRLLADLVPAGGEDAIFVSSVTGDVIESGLLDKNYWQRNMRDPVNFARGVKKLASLGMKIFVEIGPRAVLQRYIRENLGKDSGARVLSVLQKGNADSGRLRCAALSIHALSGRKNLGALFPREGSPVRLPLYPWQKQRCWFPRTSEARPTGRRSRPLLGWALSDSGATWENALDPRRETWLADHRVGEATVFPGAAYMELALEAAAEWLGRDRIALENIDIFRPLIFEDNKAQSLRCVINPGDDSLRVMSRPRLGEGEWTERTRCRALTGSSKTPSPAPVSLGEKVMDGRDLYRLASSLGLDYGPFFRRIERIRIGEGVLEAALAPRDSGDFILDPGALDACFHSVIAFFRDGDAAYLPVGAKKLEIFDATPVTRIRAFLTKVSGRSMRANFELFTGERLIARVKECRFKAMPARDSATDPDLWIMTSRLAPAPRKKAIDCGDPLNTPGALPRPEPVDEAGRRLWYREILPRLEAMALAGIANLFRNREVPGDSPYFAWMRGLLKREGILDESGAQPDDLPDWEELWLETWRLAPQFLPALLPLARTLENLPRVIRGELDKKDLLELARKDVVADERNWPGPDSAATDENIVAIAAYAAARNPGERLDILELGSPSLADRLLESIPPDRFSLARIADTRLPKRLEDRFKNSFADLRQIVADPLEWLGGKPEIDGGGFDLIILRDVLHKSGNLLAALKNISRLLRPGGMVILAEKFADWHADLLDGLDESWWQIGADGAPSSSRMPPEAWRELFRQTGFGRCSTLTDEAADGLRAGAFLLTAIKSGDLPEPEAKKRRWSLAGDDSEFLAALRDQLLAAGQEISEEGEFAVAAFADSENSPARLAALAKKLAADGRGKLRLVTRGGALIPGSPSRPLAGALTGLARVIQSEYPDLGARIIDIAPALAPAEAAELAVDELLFGDDEDEVILTGSQRRVPRLTPAAAPAGTAARCKLDIPQPGRLDNLIWTELPGFEPGDDEVEVRVMATGLNFRDIMFSMGLLPEDALENGFAGASLGLEMAGVVTKTGKKATRFKPGDRVAGFAPACFASHVLAPERALAPIPDNLDFAAAASSPTIFVTAWHALKKLAQVAPGETVLIHGGAGGVGLAAIQICKRLGARVLATAGSPEKRDLLRRLGADGVFDSRSLDFADEITELFGGVDVVLNSLAGEAMRRSAALLKPFGRFLELGKRDYVENTSLGLRPFKENISYFSIDVDQLLTAKPALAIELYEEALGLLRDGEFIPPPRRVFPASKVKEAFRAMRQARHVGKIVVDMSKLPAMPAPEGKPDFSGAWIVGGGTSGFGLACAKHLARGGATKVILASRRGPDVPDAGRIREEFEALGAKVRLEACDFSSADAVRELTEKYRDEPLTGVVHAAAVFNDKYLNDMTEEDFAVALRPKLAGAINLHEATKNLPIRYFVVFSSVSVALGNPGQGNYVAANAGLEALVLQRRKMGLPATAIAWGPVADAGYLARNPLVGKSLASLLGREPFAAETALRRFDDLAARGGVAVAANADWKTASRLFPVEPDRLKLAARLGDDGAGGASGISPREELLSLPPEEAEEKICRRIIEEAARVLEIDAALIDEGRSLQTLGLDSLMAMELALSLEQKTGLHLPPMLLQDGPTARQLARRLAGKLRGEEEDNPEASLLELARRHSEDMAPAEAREIIAEMEAGKR